MSDDAKQKKTIECWLKPHQEKQDMSDKAKYKKLWNAGYNHIPEYRAQNNVVDLILETGMVCMF